MAVSGGSIMRVGSADRGELGLGGVGGGTFSLPSFFPPKQDGTESSQSFISNTAIFSLSSLHFSRPSGMVPNHPLLAISINKAKFNQK